MFFVVFAVLCYRAATYGKFFQGVKQQRRISPGLKAFHNFGMHANTLCSISKKSLFYLEEGFFFQYISMLAGDFVQDVGPTVCSSLTPTALMGCPENQ